MTTIYIFFWGDGGGGDRHFSVIESKTCILLKDVYFLLANFIWPSYKTGFYVPYRPSTMNWEFCLQYILWVRIRQGCTIFS